MTLLYIVGGGGFGGEVAPIADAMIAAGTAMFASYRFLDDNESYLTERGAGDLLAGPISGHEVDPQAVYVCAIGNPPIRRKVVEQLQAKGARFVTLVHPAALVASSARIGEGSIICAFACVMPFTRLGRHVHLNVHSAVGHDSVLGDCCTLSAFVDVTGMCAIADGVFFGSGARTYPRVKVGTGCRIGAGVVVQRNIAPGFTLYTSPPSIISPA